MLGFIFKFLFVSNAYPCSVEQMVQQTVSSVIVTNVEVM